MGTPPHSIARRYTSILVALQSESDMTAGEEYTWDELGGVFGFKPNYFTAAGGMVPSNATGSLLLITHPGGARSFDYQDYWDGHDLIYTGRGKIGDQSRYESRNIEVAENRRKLYVFEAAGTRRLLFLGRAHNIEERVGRAPDDDGDMRNVLLFRLQFDRTRQPTPPPRDPPPAETPERQLRPRPFRDTPPAPPTDEQGDRVPQEVIAAKQEQAKAGHHDLVRALDRSLRAIGCTDVAEIPGAIDLWAIRSDGTRVIFEAKTITATNELERARGGFAQLHEYREVYGTRDDELCLVVDRALDVRRQKLLDALGMAVIVRSGDDFDAGNDLGSRLLDKLTGP
jgi:hypothetical protein